MKVNRFNSHVAFIHSSGKILEWGYLMLRRITTLIQKDFFEFCLSKSWIIVLMMPLFIGFLYLVVYKQAETKTFTLAYTPNNDPALVEVIKKSQIDLKLFPDQKAAQAALNNGKIDGLIDLNHQTKQSSLLIDKSRAQEGIFIVNAINLALINAARPHEIPQINLVYNNEQLPVRWLSLPVWLLQIILTICLLQEAAAVADEKEKQTLHSLLITPMSTFEYLFSKLLWYTILGVGALFLTILITKAPVNLCLLFGFGAAGSLAFGSLALLIGMSAPSALFARTIATLTYLISALPLMVQDLSFSWKKGLYVFPSFLVLKGFEKTLFNSYSKEISFWIAGLFIQAIALLLITHFYIRKKADF